jgi:hypothetical protein
MRVGKDTAGKWFTDERGYRRVAFADALKEAALKVDPIVEVYDYGDGIDTLSDALQRPPVVDWRRPVSNVDRRAPWERAKDVVPEVRRILQELGSAMRAVDPDIWIRPVLAKAIEANDAGVPVVVTDVRYPNEVAALKRAGFRLLHIERPGVPQLNHESENSVGAEDAHYLVRNDGDLAYLGEQLERIWDEIHALESARFAMKF